MPPHPPPFENTFQNFGRTSEKFLTILFLAISKSIIPLSMVNVICKLFLFYLLYFQLIFVKLTGIPPSHTS